MICISWRDAWPLGFIIFGALDLFGLFYLNNRYRWCGMRRSKSTDSFEQYLHWQDFTQWRLVLARLNLVLATATVGCQERYACARPQSCQRMKEWGTKRCDIQKKSDRRGEQAIHCTLWSKKQKKKDERLTWVKLNVMARMGNISTKVRWSGRNWTSRKVNNTGWAYESLILRSERRMTLAEAMTSFHLLSSLLVPLFSGKTHFSALVDLCMQNWITINGLLYVLSIIISN